MPTADVDLGELAAFALGGKPLRRNSRPAVHCVTAIAAIRAFGLEETAGKTEGGDVFVNLGLRLRLRDGFIDCPPPKRRILLRDLGVWHSCVAIYTMGGSSMYVQKSISRVCSRMQV